MELYIYIYIYICIFTCICVCVCVCVYIYSVTWFFLKTGGHWRGGGGMRQRPLCMQRATLAASSELESLCASSSSAPQAACPAFSVVTNFLCFFVTNFLCCHKSPQALCQCVCFAARNVKCAPRLLAPGFAARHHVSGMSRFIIESNAAGRASVYCQERTNRSSAKSHEIWACCQQLFVGRKYLYSTRHNLLLRVNPRRPQDKRY